MRISEVAQRAGIKATTIRFYESIGVLLPAHRVKGHRVYGADILDRLILIRFGLRMGSTLKELAAHAIKSASSAIEERAPRRMCEESHLFLRRLQSGYTSIRFTRATSRMYFQPCPLIGFGARTGWWVELKAKRLLA
jgi:DNA-binding transcriptional MerR regulator